jgi:sugar lactone lactonase YvrE
MSSWHELSAIVLIAACGSSNNTPRDDGGADATRDAMADASFDAAPDAPPVPCSNLPALTLKVATLAGCDQAGAVDGTRVLARFSNPVNVAIAPDGTTYVADFDDNFLRSVAPDGTTKTVVARPDFQKPFGLAFAPNGTLYVETDNNDSGMHSSTTGTIWSVDPTTGAASVVARNLGRPRGIVVLADGRIAMSDQFHHVVSILDPTSGAVTPLAGMMDLPGHVNANGANAQFSQPYDLVQLANTDLAVADYDNHRVREVTLAGDVTDLAGSGLMGSDNGAAATATFVLPQGLALGSDGSLYVSDHGSHLIRQITSGQVSTLAGDGTSDWLDSDVPLSARFRAVEGLDADANRLVIADGNNGDGSLFNRIRVFHLP